MTNGTLSNFDHEVFISYARGNNRPSAVEQLGWVSRFKVRLEGILLSRIPDLRIYFDDGSLLGDESPEACGVPASRSATLVVILSPLYLSRSFCINELASYVSTNGSGRIFCVLLDDVELEDRPDELKTIGYDFQHRDLIDQAIRRPMDLASPEAERQLYRLAGHLEQRLKELATANHRPSVPVVNALTRVDADRLPSGSGQFVGRTSELRWIDESIEGTRTPVIEIVARGG